MGLMTETEKIKPDLIHLLCKLAKRVHVRFKRLRCLNSALWQKLPDYQPKITILPSDLAKWSHLYQVQQRSPKKGNKTSNPRSELPRSTGEKTGYTYS